MTRPAIHPGEILRDELAELGVTPTELSRQIEVPPNRVTEIIHGRRSITGDTALRLGRWFGSSARFWLNLQSAYDLRAAEERAGQEIEKLPQRLKAETDTVRLTLNVEPSAKKRDWRKFNAAGAGFRAHGSHGFAGVKRSVAKHSARKTAAKRTPR
jgi:addiction module HigA family antidote